MRKRWKAFLEPLVGRDRKVSIAKLGVELAELTCHTGDLRADIYAYLAGTQTVTPERAFFVGEALRSKELREAKVEWSSGPIALYAVGYLADFVKVVANIASVATNADALDTAVSLALLTPLSLMLEPPTDEFEGYATGARLLLTAVYEDLGADRMREAFERESMRGWDPWLAAIAELASSGNSVELLESSVRNALCEWGLSVASRHTREGLVDDVVAYGMARFERIRVQKRAREDFADQVASRMNARFAPSWTAERTG